ncbi:2-C-methyl-D-erythritol 4-phosphate cytidylyltransferase [soil metagenome]
MKEYAIIVAGGKGTRMKSSLPKQFIELNGVPVLVHTLQAFYRYSATITIILVLPEDDFATWNPIAIKYNYTESIILQKGGASRFQSVKNGLEKISGDGLVAIHDGVRPLVSEDIIRTSFRVASIHRTAVAAVKLKESIRMIDSYERNVRDDSPELSKAVDRSRFRLIQTPQTFDVDLVKKAHQMKEDSSLTDDASVVEKLGQTIILFDGSYDNIKITTSEDLTIAEALLKKKS